ncbi:MAG: TIGR02597 family protein, partial [Planctomycetota bacterium]|nr:TIGR02597 family protein [Planctomycetota bacterium]
MRNHATAIAAVALLALAVQSASAGNVVGYNKIVVPANTDVRLSVPFTQTIQGTYTVAGKTGSTVTTSEALSASTYPASAYYVRFVSGNASGLWATISANGANSLTLADANVANLVNNGDTFRVYAHYTLGTLFPKGMYGKSYTNGTVVNIYANNIAAMAQNKSAAKTASYTTTGGGRWVGSGVSNSTILVPET